MGKDAGAEIPRPETGRSLQDALLWGLPTETIEAALRDADGRELDGHVYSPRSSSALVANAFGPFLGSDEAARRLPPLPGTERQGWPAASVRLEGRVRFPWSGGRHPNLDVLVRTANALMGIESKRFEPFDGHGAPAWSDTYFERSWGDGMEQYKAMAERSRAGVTGFRHLNEAQLVKHALGLATAAGPGMAPILVYLHAQPRSQASAHAAHAAEIAQFADAVAGDRVAFQSLTYRELMAAWDGAGIRHLRAHVAALKAFFDEDL